MTRVKICGITNLQDALCAAEAGAGMLGFIFYPKSPRYVEPDRAREIVKEIREQGFEIVTVGVFVNATPTHIVQTLDAAGIDLAQLSGDEPLEHLHDLAGRAYKGVRTPASARALIINQISGIENRHVPDLLLDADHPTLYGGSGERADESLAALLARECRLLLAGGLTPDNVASAVRHVQPWGVDVASGVETSPGRKDHDKVRAFVKAAQNRSERWNP